jgi:hypothetical protein
MRQPNARIIPAEDRAVNLTFSTVSNGNGTVIAMCISQGSCTKVTFSTDYTLRFGNPLHYAVLARR